MKAKGLSYGLWDLAWEFKHIGPVIKMTACDGGGKHQLTQSDQCGKPKVSTLD